MKCLTSHYFAAATLAAIIALAAPARANSIAVTYSLTGTGTVEGATDTTLSLATSGTSLRNS